MDRRVEIAIETFQFYKPAGFSKLFCSIFSRVCILNHSFFYYEFLNIFLSFKEVFTTYKQVNSLKTIHTQDLYWNLEYLLE